MKETERERDDKNETEMPVEENRLKIELQTENLTVPNSHNEKTRRDGK